MANVSYQPMNSSFGLQNPVAFQPGCGQMNVSMPPWLLPQKPPTPMRQTSQMCPQQMPQPGSPQMPAPQIAYVPIYVDSNGRPLLQNFLPTVGLNQFMQAPKMNIPQTAPHFVPSLPMQNVVLGGSPQHPAANFTFQPSSSASGSDSGSSCGSVSPDLKPRRSRSPPSCPPGLKLDLDTDNWANVNERLFADAGFVESKVSTLNTNTKSQKTPKRDLRVNHKKKKFGYRSKQNKIDTVYAALVTKYTGKGTLVDQDDVLRGPNVIRLHVKKYDALCSIEDALCAVEEAPDLKINGVSIPLSMKNTFQKKGFLVYIRLTEVRMVEPAQQILRKFPEFKKCGVANVAPSQ